MRLVVGNILEPLASFLAWLRPLLPLREKAGDEGGASNRPLLCSSFCCDSYAQPSPQPSPWKGEGAKACRPKITQGALILGLLVTAGCLPSAQAPTKADLKATNTPAKVPAIVHAASDDNDAVLPELIHALSDKDPAVRLFAIQSLHARTGQTLGFRYYEALEKRQAATDRWHAWLAGQWLVSEPIITGYDALPTDQE